jgi:hypothetical protein
MMEGRACTERDPYTYIEAASYLARIRRQRRRGGSPVMALARCGNTAEFTGGRSILVVLPVSLGEQQLCFACSVSSTWLHAGARLSGKRKAAAAPERDSSRTFLLDVRVSRCDTITDVAGGCVDPHVRIASRLVKSFTSVQVGRCSFRRGGHSGSPLSWPGMGTLSPNTIGRDRGLRPNCRLRAALSP